MDTEAAKEKTEKEGDPAVVGLRVEVKLFFPFFDGNGLFSICLLYTSDAADEG